MFSFAQKNDQNLNQKDLPKINDLQNHIRKCCFSYVVITAIFSKKSRLFVGKRRRFGQIPQINAICGVSTVQQLDASFLN